MLLNEILEFDSDYQTGIIGRTHLNVNTLIQDTGADDKDQIIDMIRTGIIRCRADGVWFNKKHYGTARVWDALTDWLGIVATFDDNPRPGYQNIPTIRPKTQNDPIMALPDKRSEKKPETVARWRKVVYMRDVQNMTYAAIGNEIGVAATQARLMYFAGSRYFRENTR